MLLYRYIIREHISPFLYSLFVITFLFIMDFLIHMIDSILSKGLEPIVIIEIFVLNLAWIVALSMPMAVLVASLMAYGRLSSDNEIIVLKAAGVNLYRMIFPAFVVAGLVGAFLIYFNNNILPEANHRASMLYRDISRKRPSAFIKEGFIIDDFKGFKIIIGDVNPITGDLFNIKIYQEEKESVTLTFAKRGRIEYINRGDIIRFVLFNGESHKQNAQKEGDYFRGEFKKQVIYIDNIDDSFKRSKKKRRGDREMSSKMMLKEIRKYKQEKKKETEKIVNLFHDEKHVKPPDVKKDAPAVFDYAGISRTAYQKVLNEQKRKSRNIQRKKNIILSKKKLINKYMVEVHKKYSIPAACLVFVLIGAPLGIMARASGIAIGISYSIAFFIVYWIFLIAGESLADRLIIPAWLAMWSPNILIGGAGVWLVVRMVRETTFISYEWLYRIGRYFRKKLLKRKYGDDLSASTRF
jgi:lipopolysaccharide export system permease protein